MRLLQKLRTLLESPRLANPYRDMLSGPDYLRQFELTKARALKVGRLQNGSWRYSQGSFFGETDCGWTFWAEPERQHYVVNARETRGTAEVCVRSLSFIVDHGKLIVNQRFEKGSQRVRRRVVVDLKSSEIEEVRA